MHVHVTSITPGTFNVTIDDKVTVANVKAELVGQEGKMLVTIENRSYEVTVVSQKPAATSVNSTERLHVFEGEKRACVQVPPPAWLSALAGDVLAVGSGTLKAPMPSLVVDVKVAVGQVVQKGDPIVVLESMKTETVLRASANGTVQSIGCTKGEMVEEGRTLVDIKGDEETNEAARI